MSGISGNTYTITTWGERNGKQVWRVRWSQGRPGMHATLTGPYDTIDAFVRIGDVLERLPWRADGGE